MKNLKVGQKLIVSFGIVMVLFIIAVVLSLFSISNINNRVTQFYDGAYSVRGQVKDIKENFEAMQKYTFRALSNSDPAITNESIQKSKDASTNIQNLMPQIKESFAVDPNANDQLIADLEGYLSQLAPMREEVLNLAAENKNAAAGLYMEQNNIPVIEKAVVTINQIIDYVNTNGETLMKTLQSLQSSTIILLIVVGIGCLLLCLVLCGYITRSLTTPINEMKKVAGEMAQGNLKVDILYHSQDEIGEMAEGLRQMISTLRDYIDDISYGMKEIGQGNLNINPSVEFKGDFITLRDSIVHVIFSLNDTIQRIQESANQVSTGSDQVSSGAQSLSQGATEQASSVQQLAATINDISTQVKSNADNAAQASELADSVGQKMAESNLQMKSMIEAMSEISGSSTEIAKIIKTIEDIAFQTNILALNAAVEAARAGAAGKGFAVVADEVRNLASKSADASKSTASLIETSVRSVENGTKIVNQTASSLVEAVDGAKKVSTTINKISQASENQAAAIEQVTQGVDQISSVIQTNSATAEESAASSEELSSQAQILKGLVTRFQLRDDTNPSSLHKSQAGSSSASILNKATAPSMVSIPEPAPLPAHISLGDDDKY